MEGISLTNIVNKTGLYTTLDRYAVDHGTVKGVSPETVVKIQRPCGLVTAHVEYQDGKIVAVRFESVPCFT